MSRPRRSPFAILLALLFAAACSGSIGSEGGDNGEDASGNGSNGNDVGGEDCEATPQCPDDLVCDEETGECTDSIACSEHSDCPEASHCAGGDTCRASETGSPCDDDINCASPDECLGGACGCEGTTFEAERTPVNMLMVLDRSNSMQCHIDGTDTSVGFEHPDSRWQAALGAIDELVTSFDDAIDFGLAVYPGTGLVGPGNPENALCDPDGTSGCDDELCTIGDRIVEVQEDAGEDILAALEAEENAPAGCTPSGPSLQAQVGYEELADADAENFILYITDGAENCFDIEPFQVEAIENLRDQDPEVKTFVVGFTEDVNPDELNEAAEAGGMAREGGDLSYYQANDEAVLTEALEEIGGLALSCSFALDSEPPDLEDLFVYLDDESIAHDPDREQGWDYAEEDGTPTVTLYGSACDDLQAGAIEDVSIVHGCPLVIE